MAKRTPKKPPIDDIEDLEDAEIIDDTEDEEDGDDALPREERQLEDIIAELGGRASGDILLKVYRHDARSRRLAFVDNARPDDLPLEEYLRENYGGGDYEIRVFTPTPNGGKSIKAVVPLSIANRITPAKPAAPDINFEKVLEKISENNARMIENFSKQQSLVLENILLKAGTGAQQPQGLGVADLLQMFKLFKELGGGSGGSPLSSLRDALAIKNELLDAFGGGGEGGGWSAALKAVDSLKELVKNAPQPAQPAAAVGATPSGSDVSANNVSEADMVKAVVREQLLWLCQMAAANKDSELYAALVLDQIPESFDDQLLEWLGNDNEQAVANFAEIAPEILEFKPWFLKLCAGIRANFVDDGDGAGLTPAAGSAIQGASTSMTEAPREQSTAAAAGDASHNNSSPS